MTHYDAFNGDADGICALHQLRLARPRDSVLVTGAKRDIALLQRIDAKAGDSVTALDIAIMGNREALVALLDRGVDVDYFDHHFAGEIPRHPRLRATIDTSPGVCTGILVDRFLGGRHRLWAIVAAFGDNLAAAAQALGGSRRLAPAQLAVLRTLGEALAYNAYGDREEDLLVHPAALYRIVSRHADPFDLMRAEPVVEKIDRSRQDDLDLARLARPELATRGSTVYILPDSAWSRRVRGAFSNELAARQQDLAHAVLTHDGSGGYTVSVRTPLAKAGSADALCRKFASGGGRARAAGINHLPKELLPAFVRELDLAFP